MPQSIMAVYEHGLLRPLEPLTLTESQQVKIQILSEPLADKNGHVVESPQIFSKAERRELADALARGAKKTLSEIVIEDRGQ
uniref:DUF104 domain-containing protein n=1 Tax=Candidatus Kentrum sp. TUN TaxID=2126343 RepID=A0A451B0Z4_9GAMM|nr:MAG: Protein of unknown function DUF104 [Candidatus Kentron sp. TUN]VFK71946.1 MAG: Protein of unknown function DUF104 [Candidatus Kentron sp. TUN]